MGRFLVSIIVILLITSVFLAVSTFVIRVISQATPNTLLYANFTGSAPPADWSFQGAASFVGGLNSSTGAGGIQLLTGLYQHDVILYNHPITAPNLMIEFSGMYGLGYSTCCGESPPGIADDIGAGFYSDGPVAHDGHWNPGAVHGYYAAYEFYGGSSPALIYNGERDAPLALSSGAKMPSTGVNYLLTQTMVTPSSVSMNMFSSTSGPFMAEPSISPTNILTFQGTVSNSLSTFYIGAASGGGATNVYVYWVRILSYPTTPSPPYPSLPIPEYPGYFLVIVLVIVPSLAILIALRVRRRT
jgi:hypothetical protein